MLFFDNGLHFLLEGDFFATSLETRLHPLLRQLIIAPLNISQIRINLLLKAAEFNFFGINLILAEKSDRVRERIIGVFCSILSIAYVLNSLSKRCQVSQMFLFLVCAPFRCFLLTKFVEFRFVVRIPGHVSDI